MNCTRFAELHAASVVSGSSLASPAEAGVTYGNRAEMAHLAECPACRARLQNYLVTVQVLQALGPVERRAPAPPLPETLLQRILSAHRAANVARRSGIASA